MSPLAVHVVFEHGADGQPFGSAYARLLRPLTHPGVRDRVRATFGTDYDGGPVELVIVDRLWCPDVSAAKVERLLGAARAVGARVVHALDDNFPDLIRERPGWASPDQVAALERLLAGADGLVVSTEPLAERYRAYHDAVVVVPNALDERLVTTGRVARWRSRRAWRTWVGQLRRPGRIVVGYMGTFTHDDDLRMIAPALETVHRETGGGLRIELVGVVAGAETLRCLGDVPVEVVPVTPANALYPAFVPWFARTCRWDIALSPLRDTPFTRGKSDIKFLDYAAIGAAGIYSRHPAYAGTVRHRETGWLAADDPDDWAEALGTLAADSALRRRIGAAARRYLLAERTLAHTARRLPDALEALVARAGSVGASA